MKRKCTRCGYSKCQSAIHTHHKDGNHSNNDQNNLVVLCANCHAEAHDKLGDCNGKPKGFGWKSFGIDPKTIDINKAMEKFKRLGQRA